jgi:hypothetical protein
MGSPEPTWAVPSKARPSKRTSLSWSISARWSGSVGGRSTAVLELIPYGWKANPSMNGASRPLARYASPHSRMKRVGEIVSRPVNGLSTPRGASAPPQTVISGATSLTAS